MLARIRDLATRPFVRRLLRALSLAAIGLAIVYVLAIHPYFLFPAAIGSDPSNYYAAGLRLNAGHPLYAVSPGDREVPLLLPGWTAALIAPPPIAVGWRLLALLGDASMVFWAIAAAFTTAATAVWMLRLGDPIRSMIALTLATDLAYTFWSGNVNAFILPLLVLAWWGMRSGKPAIAGVAAGVAAAVRLSPAILLVGYLAAGERKAARSFLMTGGAVAMISLVGAGLDNHLAWFDVARETIAPTGVAPASVPGLLLSVGVPGSVASGSLVVLGIAAVVGVWLLRRRPAAAFVLSVMAVVFVSPANHPGSAALLLAAAAPFASRIDRRVNTD